MLAHSNNVGSFFFNEDASSYEDSDLKVCDGVKTFSAFRKMCNVRSVSLRVKRESTKEWWSQRWKDGEDTCRCYGNEVSTEYGRWDQDKLNEELKK